MSDPIVILLPSPEEMVRRMKDVYDVPWAAAFYAEVARMGGTGKAPGGIVLGLMKGIKNHVDEEHKRAALGQVIFWIISLAPDDLDFQLAAISIFAEALVQGIKQ